MNYDAIPWVMYTSPEIAWVGKTEQQLKADGVDYRSGKFPFAYNGRALSRESAEGFIKVLADRKGYILGATIVGANAGELITAWSLAIGQKLTLRAFTDLVVPYPTLAEIWKRAAIEYYLPNLTRPMLRRIIRFLRIFG